MKKSIIVAVDAMGGDDSPRKIIKGIELFHKDNNHVFINFLVIKTLYYHVLRRLI